MSVKANVKTVVKTSVQSKLVDKNGKPLTVPNWTGPGVNPAMNVLDFFKDAVEVYEDSVPEDFADGEYNFDKKCGPFGKIEVNGEQDSYVSNKMSHSKLRIKVDGRPLMIYVFEDASRR